MNRLRLSAQTCLRLKRKLLRLLGSVGSIHFLLSATAAFGAAVYIGVRPEDVEILPANGSKPPSGMLGGTAQAALFIGERIEYQVEVEGQSTVLLYGERHQPIEEGNRVWLKLRPDGHSAWSSDWSHKSE